MRPRGEIGSGRENAGCDKTTVGRLRTSHKRGEPVAITRQMFAMGEASYRHYCQTLRRLPWALKHFARLTAPATVPVL